jgi:nitroimidazol reductase NimA-like FMN-containing flavoprotein (pyridoxamine 5'-phosphate oxidase superfamily)
MIALMKKLLTENDMCVLATCSDDVPHCSLMAYVTNAAADVIYLVTRRDSRKYANLTSNPHVSLLVDTRCLGGPAGRSEVKALTVAGLFVPVADETEKRRILKLIMERHPQLRELADHPDAEPLTVTVQSFLLLDGTLNASYVTVA